MSTRHTRIHADSSLPPLTLCLSLSLSVTHSPTNTTGLQASSLITSAHAHGDACTLISSAAEPRSVQGGALVFSEAKIFSGFSFDYFMLVHHVQPERVGLNAELVGLIFAGLTAVPSRYLNGTHFDQNEFCIRSSRSNAWSRPRYYSWLPKASSRPNPNLCLLPKTSCQQPKPSPEEAVRAYRVSPVGTEHC